MGYYRPRPAVIKSCQHCQTEFEARHKRTIYCGESCRQLAYQARQPKESKAVDQADAEPTTLDFSLQNLGVTALGASLPALLNHLLNDAPAHQEIIAKLDSIIKMQGYLQAKVDRLTDIADLQLRANPVLKQQVEQAQAQRLAQVKQRRLNKTIRKN